MSQGAPHGFLEPGEMLVHLTGELRRLPSGLEIDPARLGGDGETWWDRQAQVGHLGEVGAFAAQEAALGGIAFGEVVHVSSHDRSLSLIAVSERA